MIKTYFVENILRELLEERFFKNINELSLTFKANSLKERRKKKSDFYIA